MSKELNIIAFLKSKTENLDTRQLNSLNIDKSTNLNNEGKLFSLIFSDITYYTETEEQYVSISINNIRPDFDWEVGNQIANISIISNEKEILQNVVLKKEELSVIFSRLLLSKIYVSYPKELKKKLESDGYKFGDEAYKGYVTVMLDF
jgi:hypothetical protein